MLIFHTKTLIYLFLVIVSLSLFCCFFDPESTRDLEDEHRMMAVVMICDGFQWTRHLKLTEPIHEVLKGGREKNTTYVSSSITS